jgi:hypothetical protein
MCWSEIIRADLPVGTVYIKVGGSEAGCEEMDVLDIAVRVRKMKRGPQSRCTVFSANLNSSPP